MTKAFTKKQWFLCGSVNCRVRLARVAYLRPENGPDIVEVKAIHALWSPKLRESQKLRQIILKLTAHHHIVAICDLRMIL
jgi:hypothetical protein